METILHYFSAVDFTSTFNQVFPAIFNPIMHGLGQVFQPLFSRLMSMVEIHPSLISGTFFLTMIYLGYSFLEGRTRSVVPVEKNTGRE
ncbi:MAG: hypothetical protein WCL00_06375 [Bacteroidota bacterium]